MRSSIHLAVWLVGLLHASPELIRTVTINTSCELNPTILHTLKRLHARKLFHWAPRLTHTLPNGCARFDQFSFTHFGALVVGAECWLRLRTGRWRENIGCFFADSNRIHSQTEFDARKLIKTKGHHKSKTRNKKHSHKTGRPKAFPGAQSHTWTNWKPFEDKASVSLWFGVRTQSH